ncbi:MAG: glycine--tRNA ligase subunit beta [Rickettsiales bacterium]|jgi:glycyl-tRNA synthetase beta chain|nr:glycine--tRNA ligase subunit beta [Rickettsiales bacterium]
MAELLLELLSEEIPARMQAQGIEQLAKLVEERLKEAGLGYKTVEHYVTPRRLALVIDGLPVEQAAQEVEVKGPRVGAPEQALEGFLRSNNLTKEQLESRATPKGDFYFAVTKQSAKRTVDALKPLLENAVASITWPKSMRWGAYPVRWVRPLSSIVCLFEGKVIPIEFGPVKAGNTTRGHRFLGGKAFTVANANDYRKGLKDAYVVLNRDERKRQIWDDAVKLGQAKGLVVKEDAGLLDEVAGLVEYPVALMGSIDQQFMRVPQEVLITSMRTHQKYFSVLTADGKLAPYFITVSNIKTDDKGAEIIAGNERVLRARLSDAAFFWDQDRKVRLNDRENDLEKVIFHAKLGTVADKAKRITVLAKAICAWVPNANTSQVERAARLAKADLTTGMVGEFAELQGIMGRYYAEHDGEDAEVARAISEHYQPAGQQDAIPTAPVSIALALADKIDSLVGLFAVDEKPTGSKDPFALRRAALGVIRIIMENRLQIPLKRLFEKSLQQYPKAVVSDGENLATKLLKRAKGEETPESSKDRIVEELLEFFAERLKASLKSDNVRHDLIAAVFNGGTEDDLFRLVDRVRSLERFTVSDDGKNLLSAYRRAANILKIEEKKDGFGYEPRPSRDFLTQKEEKDLYKLLKESQEPITKAIEGDRFEEAMQLLSALRAPVDAFFEKVTVNTDNAEVRANRLRLLSQIRSLMDAIANFSSIDG